MVDNLSGAHDSDGGNELLAYMRSLECGVLEGLARPGGAAVQEAFDAVIGALLGTLVCAASSRVLGEMK